MSAAQAQTAQLREALRALREEFGIDYTRLAYPAATVDVTVEGARLIQLRKALHLTLSQCARWAGISLSTWQEWERGAQKRTTQEQALARVVLLLQRAEELGVFALLAAGAEPESRPCTEAQRRKLLYRCTACGRELNGTAVDEHHYAEGGRQMVRLEHDGGCGPVAWARNPDYPVPERERRNGTRHRSPRRLIAALVGTTALVILCLWAFTAHARVIVSEAVTPPGPGENVQCLVTNRTARTILAVAEWVECTGEGTVEIYRRPDRAGSSEELSPGESMTVISSDARACRCKVYADVPGDKSIQFTFARAYSPAAARRRLRVP